MAKERWSKDSKNQERARAARQARLDKMNKEAAAQDAAQRAANNLRKGCAVTAITVGASVVGAVVTFKGWA